MKTAKAFSCVLSVLSFAFLFLCAVGCGTGVSMGSTQAGKNGSCGPTASPSSCSKPVPSDELSQTLTSTSWCMAIDAHHQARASFHADQTWLQDTFWVNADSSRGSEVSFASGKWTLQGSNLTIQNGNSSATYNASINASISSTSVSGGGSVQQLTLQASNGQNLVSASCP